VKKHLDGPFETENLGAQARQAASLCKKALVRIGDKIEKQEIELTEARHYITYQQWADTLLSITDEGKKGNTEVTTHNIHSGLVERIALNPKFTMRQNAQLYYKKSKKGKRGLDIIEKKIADSRAAQEQLKLIYKECNALLETEVSLSDYSEKLDSVSQALRDLGFAPPQTQNKPRQTADSSGTPYREFIFEDWRILIGKNDSQNDELTVHEAHPQDIWMHVAGCAGSHVVIRREKNGPQPPREILLKAASLAVWFSRAKHTSSSEVHFTEARYVHKRRKSAPGQVIMQQFQSIRVAPVSPQVYFPGHYAQ
jgi:predicted ribosome quality control (RQC) complex YloA/Tae2 family protein